MTKAATPTQNKKSTKTPHPLSDRKRYKVWNTDKLRLTDVDHQHHVNNAIFAVLYTSVRADFLAAYVRPLVAKTDMFAMVKITIEYLAEMHYPGQVEVGIAIKKLGSSSLTFAQAMYKDGVCVSVAEAVMVLLDPLTRRAKPLPTGLETQLKRFIDAAE
ncbi:MAG: Thioesterase superfamily protein [Betaproteobacteria bacterium]|nr:Thioesterase superfamily protein [Betaproteobacteria bacterium]